MSRPLSDQGEVAAERPLGDYRPQGGGRRASVTEYRTVKRPGHPLAQADGKVYVHRLVLFEKIGPGVHPCHWCQKDVAWLESPRLVADHLDSDGWNNDPANLVPACDYCNSARKSRTDFLTHCPARHEWTPATLALRPNGDRWCRACAADREKRRPPRRRTRTAAR